MIDWEKLRSMMRQDLNRFVSQEKLTDKDYCDLKLILSNMERSYTNEMFEREGYEASGARGGYNSNSSRGYYDNAYASSRASGRVAPYYDMMEMPNQYYNASHGQNGGQNYSGHSQEQIFKSQLQAMAHTAEDANTRRVIQEAMDRLR